MVKHLARGAIAGVLAGIILGFINIVLGLMLNDLFLSYGMSLTGSVFVVTSLITGVMYGVIFGGAYRLIYHSLPARLRGVYYGMFIWVIAGVVSMTNSILYSGISIIGSGLVLIMNFVSYIIFGTVLEILYEKVKF